MRISASEIPLPESAAPPEIIAYPDPTDGAAEDGGREATEVKAEPIMDSKPKPGSDLKGLEASCNIN